MKYFTPPKRNGCFHRYFFVDKIEFHTIHSGKRHWKNDQNSSENIWSNQFKIQDAVWISVFQTEYICIVNVKDGCCLFSNDSYSLSLRIHHGRYKADMKLKFHQMRCSNDNMNPKIPMKNTYNNSSYSPLLIQKNKHFPNECECYAWNKHYTSNEWYIREPRTLMRCSLNAGCKIDVILLYPFFLSQ